MRAHSNLRGWVATDVSDPIGVGPAIASFGTQVRVKAVGSDGLPELVGAGPGHRPSRRQGA